MNGTRMFCTILVGVLLLGEAAAQEASTAVDFGPEQGLQVRFDGGRHRLQLHTAVWVRFQVTHEQPDTTDYGFTVPLVRPVFQASILDGLVETFIQPEFADPTRLLDAFVDFNARPEVRFRVGIFRSAYSRAFIAPILHLALPGRGIVSDDFRIGRHPGVQFFGATADNRLEYALSVHASPQDSSGATVAAPIVIARLGYRFGGPVPLDQSPAVRGSMKPGALIAVSGAFQRTEGGNLVPDAHIWHASVDLSVVAGPFALTSEGFYRQSTVGSADATHEWGTFVQAGVFAVPRILEFAARGLWMDRVNEEQSSEYEAGLNFYIPTPGGSLGHHAKLQVSYTYAPRTNRAVAPHTLTAQLQAFF